VKAVAILGPYAAPDHVRPFQLGAAMTIERSIPADADAVLIFGGDGTVHRHLARLVKTRIPLLVVPVGSGNDFAWSLGLGTRHQALAAWQRFTAGRQNFCEIDVGLITPTGNQKLETGNFFCCIGGAGLDAATNRRANAMPRWLRARGGYVLGALAGIVNFHPQRMTVGVSDGAGGWTTRISEAATMVAFANAPRYGHGMRMAPRAQLDDGKLDVCFVRGASKLRLLMLFPTVFWGAHLRLREIEYFQTARLRLETESATDIYADGEFICKTPAEVSVVPRGLRVIAGSQHS
jgi:diacylglycerol kinase (ATP)